MARLWKFTSPIGIFLDLSIILVQGVIGELMKKVATGSQKQVVYPEEKQDHSLLSPGTINLPHRSITSGLNVWQELSIRYMSFKLTLALWSARYCHFLSPATLYFDPTCGSGTTAYVAEQWGRRWITTDTSRVALALARARANGSALSLLSIWLTARAEF